MRLRVDALPRSVGDTGYQPYADTVLVVDTLRATTTAGVFLEQGAESLYLCPTLESALAFRGEGVVLAGERNCLPPDGFELGNSPLEASQRRFDNQIVVMSTSNGTHASSVAGETGKHVLLASLRNAHAAARKAREVSSEELAILCAGSGGRIGLDDVYTAGVLCEYLLAMGEWTLDDGAQIALTVRRQFADPMEPLSRSRAAELIAAVGLEGDIAMCAEVSRSTIVPAFTGRSGSALIFRAA
jgi:2-phosphosulfolactate phosphatase